MRSIQRSAITLSTESTTATASSGSDGSFVIDASSSARRVRGEPAMGGERDRVLLRAGRRPREAQLRDPLRGVGRRRRRIFDELLPQHGDLCVLAIAFELRGDRMSCRECLDATTRERREQLGAFVEQLEPAFVVEDRRGGDRDVEAAQPAEHRTVHRGAGARARTRIELELRPAQAERGRRILTAIEDQRGSRCDFLGLALGGQRAAPQLDDARPVADHRVRERGELERVGRELRGRRRGECQLDRLDGARGLAVPP
jgi:hypothetical protein